jgi:hypothetical protein
MNLAADPPANLAVRQDEQKPDAPHSQHTSARGQRNTVQYHARGRNDCVKPHDTLLEVRQILYNNRFLNCIRSPTDINVRLPHEMVAMHIRLVYVCHEKDPTPLGYPKMSPERCLEMMKMFRERALELGKPVCERCPPSRRAAICDLIIEEMYKDGKEQYPMELKKNPLNHHDKRYMHNGRHVLDKVETLLRIVSTYPDDTLISGGHGCFESTFVTMAGKDIASSMPLIPVEDRASMVALMEFLLGFREDYTQCEEEFRIYREKKLSSTKRPRSGNYNPSPSTTTTLALEKQNAKIAADNVIYNQMHGPRMAERAEELQSQRSEARESLSSVVHRSASVGSQREHQESFLSPGSQKKRQHASSARDIATVKAIFHEIVGPRPESQPQRAPPSSMETLKSLDNYKYEDLDSKLECLQSDISFKELEIKRKEHEISGKQLEISILHAEISHMKKMFDIYKKKRNETETEPQTPIDDGI